MSSAQPRTSCTKRSWSTARSSSSTRRAVVARPPRRRLSSPPGVRQGRHPGSPWHSPSRSPTWTCRRSTAGEDCRTCRGRKGCRTAAPASNTGRSQRVHVSFLLDLSSSSALSSGDRSRIPPRAKAREIHAVANPSVYSADVICARARAPVASDRTWT